MKEYLKLFRVKHYTKNLLIFLPLFFSKNIFNGKLLLFDIIGFLAFSIVTSITYVINDIEDVDKDRMHPTKKNRPLASGKISIKAAKISAAALAALAIILVSLVYLINDNIFTFIIPLAYFVMNILYSKKLKHVPIIDVAIISIGFLFRVFYGSVLANVTLSNWLYLMIMFGAFYLGFGKRRNEIINNGTKSRKSLQMYNKNFLDKNMYVCLGLSIMSYSMWCIDKMTLERIGNNYMIYTVLLLIIILQVYSLIIENESHGDPIEVITENKWLILLILLYIIILFIIIYII